MEPDRSIDDLLGDALALQGEYDDYDHAAARARIAQRLSDDLVRGTRLWDCTQDRLGVKDYLRPGPAEPHPAYATLHEQARRDLAKLSSLVVNDPRAVNAVVLLEDSPRIEPTGALTFACLLEVTGLHEGAQFWWQFAAGAGNHTAAYCLYLHHMKRGEFRDAGHWFDQAAHLSDSPAPSTPRCCFDVLHTDVFIEYHAATGHPADPNAAPPPALQAAVEPIEMTRDDDYGTVPLPDRLLVDAAQ